MNTKARLVKVYLSQSLIHFLLNGSLSLFQVLLNASSGPGSGPGLGSCSGGSGSSSVSDYILNFASALF